MILTLDKAGTLSGFLRNIFGTFDYLIYTLISKILSGIFELANLSANVGLVKLIYKRIYVILALFMVFKLTFSFINYIISPDSMNDKEKGVGKLISRTIVMLALLIILPIILFENLVNNQTILNALQNGVIRTLPKIILGIEAQNGSNNISLDPSKTGDFLALTMLEAFYYPAECNSESPAYEGKDCANQEYDIKNLKQFSESLAEQADKGGVYKYQYMYPLTTIAGILLVVILLGFAIDVAIRVFKMIILQMIAPVPVMSYIDPKSSKDGAFSHWLKSFGSTYVEIFVKLGSIYILLLLLEKVFVGDDKQRLFEDLSGGRFLKVFLIIGLFKFIKDAPKFIKDAIGMKDNGSGGMFGGLSTLGATAGTLGGAALGLAGGVAGGIASARAAGDNGAKAALKGIGGGLSGIVRGGTQGAKGAGKGNPFKGIGGAISSQNAVTQRKMAAAASGSTWSGRMKARADQLFRGETAADADERNLDKLGLTKEGFDRTATTNGALYDYIKDRAIKKNGNKVVAAKHATYGTLAMSYNDFNTAYQNAKISGASTFSVTTASGHTITMDTNAGETDAFMGDLLDASATDWAINNSSDVTLQQYETDAGVTNGTYTADQIKDAKKTAERNSRGIQRQIHGIKHGTSYKANKADKDAIKK